MRRGSTAANAPPGSRTRPLHVPVYAEARRRPGPTGKPEHPDKRQRGPVVTESWQPHRAPGREKQRPRDRDDRPRTGAECPMSRRSIRHRLSTATSCRGTGAEKNRADPRDNRPRSGYTSVCAHAGRMPLQGFSVVGGFRLSLFDSALHNQRGSAAERYTTDTDNVNIAGHGTRELKYASN